MSKSKYSVKKRDGLWWVIDNTEGFEVSYIGHDFKYEAIASAKVRAAEDAAEKRNADRIDGYDRDDLGESPDY